MLFVAVVISELVVVDTSEFASVENPCETLGEWESNGEDGDPEVSLGSALSFSTWGGNSTWEGHKSEESNNLEDSNASEEDVNQADSAFQEWDQLVVWEEQESNVEEDPNVSNDEAEDAWLIAVGQGEADDWEEKSTESANGVGKSQSLGVFVMSVVCVHFKYLLAIYYIRPNSYS